MPALRSSSFSTSVGFSAATCTRGRRVANTAPAAYTTAPRPTASWGPYWSPPTLSRISPGPPATMAAIPLSMASLELASTSSWSLRTVVGTTEAREIRYAFWNTSIRKAST